jgi:hypothetical protein
VLVRDRRLLFITGAERCRSDQLLSQRLSFGDPDRSRKRQSISPEAV